MKPDIKYLFEPRTVAIIGASHNPEKIGYKITENIVLGGYTGKVYPVNPKGGEILGLPVCKALEEINDDIDMAIIAVPGKYVFDTVKSCAKKGVKILPVISSGFSEVGNTHEEKEIVSFARDHGMRVLGPNIFGIYSAVTSLNAAFGPSNILKGGVAIVTQSGALGGAMIGKTAVENIGLSTIVSVGNKSDIDEADLLEYLMESGQTTIILMYIEGVKEGERLVEALKKATQKKPVVVIKSGRSARGAMAAASHTGSLAGADEIFDAIMRQCGVLRAENLEEAFNWCKFLAGTSLPQGENAVIITNGGGLGVLATDACEKYGVNLYDDLEILRKIFSEVTPAFGSTKNPVDLTGQATAEHYRKALKAALAQENIHAVIALYCETAVFDLEALSSVIKENHKIYKGKKPVIFSLLGGGEIEKVIDVLIDEGVPVYSDAYDCVSSLGALYSYYHHLSEEEGITPEYDIDCDEIHTIVNTVLKEKRYFLLSHEAQTVVKAAGIPIPQSFIARNLTEAVQYAGTIGYPVVMKVVSKDIIHKSDAGGVALDLENEEEVIDAYQAIMRNARRYKRNAQITGVEVTEMVQSGTETIIGARRDASFGPIVMFGLGGIYVEVLKDVSFRAYPVTHKEVLTMMEETRSYPLLLGVRGEEQKDIDDVVETILKVGAVLNMCPPISDIEINPLVVYEHGQGVKAVDVRILLKRGDING
ncbi:MAG: acetate--CoA ligase family protein [Theionarchaea archaeon]|nr:acetate--CoA ligase family protein [Theionarchaea archaeon]